LLRVGLADMRSGGQANVWPNHKDKEWLKQEIADLEDVLCASWILNCNKRQATCDVYSIFSYHVLAFFMKPSIIKWGVLHVD
jgi:hypothetical protein